MPVVRTSSSLLPSTPVAGVGPFVLKNGEAGLVGVVALVLAVGLVIIFEAGLETALPRLIHRRGRVEAGVEGRKVCSISVASGSRVL